jgi:predicted O-methyltransferase YrrM
VGFPSLRGGFDSRRPHHLNFGSCTNPLPSPNAVIERIYRTREAVGRSGRTRKVYSAIDAEEGEFLLNLIRNDANVVRTLEVGCANGLASLHICAALQDRPLASHTIIDPEQNGYWDGAGLLHLAEAGITFSNLVELGSEIALPGLLEKHEGKFDFVFIDGMHTFDHTLLDCFYATRLLRIGGYLAIDDVDMPSVHRVIRYYRNYPCYELVGRVRRVVRPALRRRLLLAFMQKISRPTWEKILPAKLCRRLHHDGVTRMLALKKVAADVRDWDWHNDDF